MKPPVLSIEESKQLDHKTINEMGFPSALLMENAGRQLATVIQKLIEKYPMNSHILFLCGKGKNAGDGFVAARHLLGRCHVAVYMMDPKAVVTGDPQIFLKILKNLNVPLLDFAQFFDDLKTFKSDPLLIVDCILGTGFRPPLSDRMKEIFQRINQLKKFHPAKILTVSADLPSGLNGDDGSVDTTAFQADVTVTFGSIKKGCLTAQAKMYVGRLEFADIGIPEKLLFSK